MSILLTLSLLVTLLVPMVGPASAKSLNSVDKVLSVSDDWVGTNNGSADAPVLTIKEDTDFKNHFRAGDTFKLVLPSKVKWPAQASIYVGLNGNPLTDASSVLSATYAVKRTDQVLEVTFPSAAAFAGTDLNDNNVDTINVVLNATVDGASGSIAVKVEPMDSTVTGGEYAFLTIGSGKTVAVAESVETIAETGTGGKIRIDETYVSGIGDGQETMTLKLPGNFEWNSMTAAQFSFSGGFAGATVDSLDPASGAGSGTLTVKFTPPASRSKRGSIYITPLIKAKSGASYGDVSVSVSGTDMADADLIVAKYADFGVDFKVKEVKELLAGKFDDVKTEKITIEELVPGSMIGGRNLTVTLPDWVKITGNSDWNVSGGSLAATRPTLDGTTNDFDIPITTASSGATGKIEFKLILSIEGNKTGDIEAKIKGAGIAETKLVIAKAVAAVSATAEVKDLRIGVQSQEVSDITITELKKAAIEKKAETASTATDGAIKLTLPTGVKFAATPKVAVTSGDLELKTEEARLITDDSEFTVPVKSESIKPSTIKISGIKLTLDRNVPEGDLFIKVKGNAIIENDRGSNGYLVSNAGVVTQAGGSTNIDAGEFDTATAVKIKVGNCVTPAPGELKAVSSFKIGDTKFKMNGVEKTMDVAPYIKDSRTYMPLRFVAQAAGVADANIMWNAADQSVVLIKGDRVVKLTIGSTTMLINGVTFTMDVAPEIVDPGRTMLPIRWVAQALGADVQWDEATQTVTVK